VEPWPELILPDDPEDDLCDTEADLVEPWPELILPDDPEDDLCGTEADLVDPDREETRGCEDASGRLEDVRACP